MVLTTMTIGVLCVKDGELFGSKLVDDPGYGSFYLYVLLGFFNIALAFYLAFLYRSHLYFPKRFADFLKYYFFKLPVYGYILLTALFVIRAIESKIDPLMIIGIFAGVVVLYLFNAFCFYFLGRVSRTPKREMDFLGNYFAFITLIVIVFMYLGNPDRGGYAQFCELQSLFWPLVCVVVTPFATSRFDPGFLGDHLFLAYSDQCGPSDLSRYMARDFTAMWTVGAVSIFFPGMGLGAAVAAGAVSSVTTDL